MTAAPSYTLVEPARRDRARIRFAGRFDGEPVMWDAEVIALRAVPDAPSAAPYIEVGAVGPHGQLLRVGLALAAIDAPALAKTVVMIRNYKRLRHGYMRFGEPGGTPAQVISGGQTGVDRAALDAASARGIATGGYCPKGRRAEDGVIPARYRLTELRTVDYPARTRRNARAADATLILTRGRLAGGSAYTAAVVKRLGKPLQVVDLASRPQVAPLRAWLASHDVHVLNVAGPRESKAPGIYQQAKRFLLRLWTEQASRRGRAASLHQSTTGSRR